MYDKVPTNLNFVEREVQTEQFWKEQEKVLLYLLSMMDPRQQTANLISVTSSLERSKT